MSKENDNPTKITAILEDLRVQKEQNRLMKSKVYEAERASRVAHEGMVKLEETNRELKRVAEETKKQHARSKQTERLNEAADKIDELVQANSYLNAAKDKAVKLTGKQRQAYAR